MSENVKAFIRRTTAKVAALPPEETEAAASTPQQKLVQAAHDGRFEILVDEARPEQPPVMVTPEEREAERRRTGRWPEDKPPDKPKAAKEPKAKEPKPKEPPRELTPNEQYIAEYCRWGKRRPNEDRPHHQPGRCLTEYNVLTGEIIGDGYDHSGEDDEW